MFFISLGLPFQSLVKLPAGNPVHFVAVDKGVTTNKNFEFQLSRWVDNSLFSFELTLDFIGRDHAGPNLLLTVAGFTLVVGLHDRRHWNDEARRWMTDQEMVNQFYDPSVTLH